MDQTCLLAALGKLAAISNHLLTFYSLTLTAMATSGAADMIPISSIFSTESDAATTDEEPHHAKHSQLPQTPTIAIQSFDGQIQTVRARSLIRSCGTRHLWTFLLHSFALLFSIILGAVMMIMTPLDEPTFSIWSGIFAMGVGGTVPSPTMVKPK